MQRLRATTILRQDVVAVNGTFLTGSGISSPTRQGTPGLHPLAQGDHVPDPDADQQHPGRQKLPRYFGPDLRKVRNKVTLSPYCCFTSLIITSPISGGWRPHITSTPAFTKNGMMSFCFSSYFRTIIIDDYFEPCH